MTRRIHDRLRLGVRVLGLALLCAGVTGCASFDVGIWGSSGPDETGSPGHEGPPAHGKLGIPPGHLPPPGECRIWYPGQPPGQQPPPGKCDQLRHNVPIGAWLIEHPKNDGENVHVNVYDPERRDHRIEIRIYNATTGVYVGAKIP